MVAALFSVADDDDAHATNAEMPLAAMNEKAIQPQQHCIGLRWGRTSLCASLVVSTRHCRRKLYVIERRQDHVSAAIPHPGRGPWEGEVVQALVPEWARVPVGVLFRPYGRLPHWPMS